MGRLYQARGGFTLIELSIVLVIIGLIVGGVLVGQSLIRTAELQSIVKDVNTFTTAIYTFEDKYGALPGDMSNATDYWGINPNCAIYGAGTGTQTCNGNGDGWIDSPQEVYTAWQHLGNAGLIAGSYSGVDGSAYPSETSIPGQNVPASKLAGAGWSIGHEPSAVGNPYTLDGSYDTHVMQFGTPAGVTLGPIISPMEAYSIDLKIDDGNPAFGRVRGLKALANP